jgi:FlaA1/EpsC-like NDP-sugar epimerase
MSYIRRFRNYAASYQFVHTVTNRIAALLLLAFMAFCFWLIFQHAEPTTVTLAILAYMTATGMFLMGGQRSLDSWVHKDVSTYQQTTTTATTGATTPGAAADDTDPPINPASQDVDR